MMDKLPNGKSLASGIALIVLGVAGLVVKLFSPESEFAMDVESAIAAISAGLGIIGLAHKSERARAEVRELSSKVERLSGDTQDGARK
jgi:hypothetical protein